MNGLHIKILLPLLLTVLTAYSTQHAHQQNTRTRSTSALYNRIESKEIHDAIKTVLTQMAKKEFSKNARAISQWIIDYANWESKYRKNPITIKGLYRELRSDATLMRPLSEKQKNQFDAYFNQYIDLQPQKWTNRKLIGALENKTGDLKNEILKSEYAKRKQNLGALPKHIGLRPKDILINLVDAVHSDMSKTKLKKRFQTYVSNRLSPKQAASVRRILSDKTKLKLKYPKLKKHISSVINDRARQNPNHTSGPFSNLIGKSLVYKKNVAVQRQSQSGNNARNKLRSYTNGEELLDYILLKAHVRSPDFKIDKETIYANSYGGLILKSLAIRDAKGRLIIPFRKENNWVSKESKKPEIVAALVLEDTDQSTEAIQRLELLAKKIDLSTLALELDPKLLEKTAGTFPTYQTDLNSKKIAKITPKPTKKAPAKPTKEQIGQLLKQKMAKLKTAIQDKTQQSVNTFSKKSKNTLNSGAHSLLSIAKKLSDAEKAHTLAKKKAEDEFWKDGFPKLPFRIDFSGNPKKPMLTKEQGLALKESLDKLGSQSAQRIAKLLPSFDLENTHRHVKNILDKLNQVNKSLTEAKPKAPKTKVVPPKMTEKPKRRTTPFVSGNTGTPQELALATLADFARGTLRKKAVSKRIAFLQENRGDELDSLTLIREFRGYASNKQITEDRFIYGMELLKPHADDLEGTRKFKAYLKLGLRELNAEEKSVAKQTEQHEQPKTPTHTPKVAKNETKNKYDKEGFKQRTKKPNSTSGLTARQKELLAFIAKKRGEAKKTKTPLVTRTKRQRPAWQYPEDKATRQPVTTTKSSSNAGNHIARRTTTTPKNTGSTMKHNRKKHSLQKAIDNVEEKRLWTELRIKAIMALNAHRDTPHYDDKPELMEAIAYAANLALKGNRYSKIQVLRNRFENNWGTKLSKTDRYLHFNRLTTLIAYANKMNQLARVNTGQEESNKNEATKNLISMYWKETRLNDKANTPSLKEALHRMYGIEPDDLLQLVKSRQEYALRNQLFTLVNESQGKMKSDYIEDRKTAHEQDIQNRMQLLTALKRHPKNALTAQMVKSFEALIAKSIQQANQHFNDKKPGFFPSAQQLAFEIQNKIQGYHIDPEGNRTIDPQALKTRGALYYPFRELPESEQKRRIQIALKAILDFNQSLIDRKRDELNSALARQKARAAKNNTP